MSTLENIHIASIDPIPSPHDLKSAHPLSITLSNRVIETRQHIRNIITKKDPRFLVVIGPCSIHDVNAALAYAERLAPFVKKYQKKCIIVMRVYFEKPRTTIGWKGLINDPDLDGSNRIEKGLKTARELLISVLEMGIPTGTELLDPILPQYYADTICWASIGARTSESQTHREMASGLSMPIGFKNATDGNIEIALQAIESARHSHTFIGVTQAGSIAKVSSKGNLDSHLIIRGGNNGPNYSSVQMAEHSDRIRELGIRAPILVDCSHGNSRKKAANQSKVLNSILNQRVAGNNAIIGAMIESFLVHGNQPISPALVYGQSITDECIDWEETNALLAHIYDRLP